VSGVDLDLLRANHAETRDAALELAAAVAERVTDGPFDTGALALTHGLAANLTMLLRREKSLRRAVKAEVAG
jgi:hypothetical protein